MTEKPKPAPKSPSAWRGKPGYEHYGDLKPVVYGDTPGKRLGTWLMGLLTPWQR